MDEVFRNGFPTIRGCVIYGFSAASMRRAKGDSPMRSAKVMSVVSLATVLTGCSPSSFDAAAEGRKLLARDQEWSALASAGQDVDRTVSYWSADAITRPQGQPAIEGKAAIRAFVTSSFHTPGFNIHWTSRLPTFSVDGTLAYMHSETVTTVPGPNGAPLTIHS